MDLYSGSAFLWAEAACWTLRRVQRPYVLTLRGGDLPKFAGRRPRVVARLLRSAAAVTAPSRYLLEKMERYRADNNATILLASHNMLEVERLCDRVIIMKRGRIEDDDSPQQIMARYNRTTLEEVFLDVARGRVQEGTS